MNKNKVSTEDKYKEAEKKLLEKKLEVTKQQEVVKKLKDSKASKSELKNDVEKLKKLKEEVEKLTNEWIQADPNKLNLNRKDFEQLMTSRFFYIPSFEIYSGPSGFYDYGPSCCAIKSNLISLWRKHFIIEENMLELDCCCVTPEKVFIASGHVAKFSDFMVTDLVTKEYFRADKLIAEFIEKEMKSGDLSEELTKKYQNVLLEIDSYSQSQLDSCIKDLGVKSPKLNSLSPAYPFNLMFSTQIGPTGKSLGYLRPETAQGLFVNFKRLLKYNGDNMPFAAATIGQAFRNEISPRSGLLRVREFTLAEIEHFVHPQKKDHPKFYKVENLKISIFPRENQVKKLGYYQTTIKDALEKGTFKNQTISYFIGRVYLFMLRCGLLEKCIRFRQHLSNEMAHYASDCWDCELLTSYGWIECVGIADRACFDLSNHAKFSQTDMSAWESFDKPKIVEDFNALPKDKTKFGKVFKKDGKAILESINSKSIEEKEKMSKDLSEGKIFVITIDDQEFKITSEDIVFKKVQTKISGETYIPSVIEPSFGLGRIIYSLLEQSYWVRDEVEEEKDKKSKKKDSIKMQRHVLSLAPSIAPYKVLVLPQSINQAYEKFLSTVRSNLSSAGVSYRIDTSSVNIGKRYARADDIGIPFAITVDKDSLKDETVTLRERDSCEQVRTKIDVIVQLIVSLVGKKITWEEVKKKYPAQKETASTKVGKK